MLKMGGFYEKSKKDLARRGQGKTISLTHRADKHQPTGNKGFYDHDIVLLMSEDFGLWVTYYTLLKNRYLQLVEDYWFVESGNG